MDEQELDLALEPALDIIDRATMALQLSRIVNSPVDSVEHARQAHVAFETALFALFALPRVIRTTTAWQHWIEESRHGIALASEYLKRHGA